MNYANMIEEKNLKKTFIIATLVSTLIGTFASSHNLYERLRDKHQQEKKDESQNQEIKKLKEEIDGMKKKKGSRDDSSSSSSDSDRPRGSRSRSRRRGRDRLTRDDLLEYLDRSPALIRKEYDQGYDRWGQRFAAGDVVTENQLQTQIIMFQQTVIHVLQDALTTNRRLRRADIDRLIQASQAAQDGSVDALRSQYHRLQSSGTYIDNTRRRRSLPPPKLRQIADAPSSSSATVLARAVAATKPATSAAAAAAASRVLAPDAANLVGLFCRYSVDLQETPRKNLNVAFAPGGARRCPACDVYIPVDGEDSWTIGKRRRSVVDATTAAASRNGNGNGSGDREGGGERQELVVEHCEFHVTARFVVKCHTESGEYACVLCSRGRGIGVVCADPEALVAHIGRKHRIGEYEREIDLVQD
ncbi:MAG: hypothetical protein M1822_000800 [Bathelium mastoideum]|nr:MAG: hypothetical protein M1822_000800 [Bathelium mastoideum]